MPYKILFSPKKSKVFFIPSTVIKNPFILFKKIPFIRRRRVTATAAVMPWTDNISTPPVKVNSNCRSEYDVEFRVFPGPWSPFHAHVPH